MLGPRWTRRIGRTMIALAVVPFVLGVAVFLTESQTIGRILMGIGAFCGLVFVVFRRGPDAVLAGLRARRWVLVALGSATALAGWVVYFALSETIGLLLVVLAALPLVLTLFDVRREPLASPLDGPPFGETGGG
jgi:hypothetical protein